MKDKDIKKDRRPNWCPHKDCKFIEQSQDKICAGELPVPEPHGIALNTHRFCLDTRTESILHSNEDEHGVFDLQLNHGDVWNMIRILKTISSNRYTKKWID